MKLTNAQRIKNVCVVLLGFLSYSSPYWIHFFATEVKNQFNYFDRHVLNVQLVSLLSNTASQVILGGFTDTCDFPVILITCIVHCAIPMIIIDNSVRRLTLLFAYGWFCFSVAIIHPSVSKLYGTIFSGIPMNVGFCFLTYTMATAQTIGNIFFFHVYYAFVDGTTLYYVCVPLLMMASILIYMTITKSHDTPIQQSQKKVSFSQIMMTPKVQQLSICVMCLRFCRDFFFDALPPRIVRSSMLGLFFSRFVSAVCGLAGSLVISLFSRKPLDALLQMHFICAVIIFASSFLIELEIITGDVVVFIFGVFYEAPEAILSGYIAVQIGETLGNAGGRVAALVNGFGTIGKAVATVVVYNMPKYSSNSSAIFAVATTAYFVSLFFLKRSLIQQTLPL